MRIVWNRIQVNEGFEERFERRQERGEGEEIQGILYFAILRSDDPGVYINMSM